MSHRIQTLARSPLGSVVDYACQGHRRTPRSSEEATFLTEVAFVRRGSVLRRNRHGRDLGDPARVLLFNAGEPYTIEHPADGGDRCTVVAVTPTAIRHVFAAGDAPETELDRPFTRCTNRDATPLQPLHREILAAEDGDAQRLDELILELLGRLLTRPGEAPSAQRASRAGRELARAVEVHLADAFAGDVTLDTLAARFRVSPYHLLRVFRAETGRSIRQHVISLRLNAAVDDLVGGNSHITAIALKYGFSDHAHFTTSFVRAFGVPPGRWRRRRA